MRDFFNLEVLADLKLITTYNFCTIKELLGNYNTLVLQYIPVYKSDKYFFNFVRIKNKAVAKPVPWIIKRN